ncbi:cholinesterase 1 [Galendromus occidentalis]|uniref:Carboxylic ester hydrolase n=1 Tax=Galendromus occidentalis TaxID=34638 RepID=A0AAJ6QQN2_9ACAR|nr:cholinesterase 1 [Galendromus occidentalis]
MELLILLCCFIVGLSGKPIVVGKLGRISGRIQRVLDVDIEFFLGIPYAEPPVGEHRFALPRAFGAVGEVEATEYGPSCLQPSSGPLAPENRKLSEDCLRLNVFRRQGTNVNDKKAVIVTLHGGGFVAGSSSDPLQNTAALAGLGDVVVVSLNYRLGILGFADMKEFAPGNLGLRDQRLALEWVQDYIADFGGDPGRVTVMGVSAGSMSIAAQIITPIDERNLFSSVVMDAGVVASNGFHEDSDSSYSRLTKIAEQVGCPLHSLEMVDCLRKIEAERLIAFSLNTTGDNGISYFVATLDGDFIPREVEDYVRENSSNLRKVRTIIGYARDEGSFFVSSKFMAKDHPNPESTDEVMAYMELLSQNYDYPLNFGEEKTRELLSRLYIERHPNDSLAAIASLQSDGIFKCSINNFIRSYTQYNEEVYVYQFERELKSVYAKILDPNILGAFHLSPFLHFCGSLFLGPEPLHPDDRTFILESIDLISRFAKAVEPIEFRGLKWPRFAESEEVLYLHETPWVRDGLPSEHNCRALFQSSNNALPKKSSNIKLRTEL